ncbi:hypothetical protein NSU18_21115 [Paenibacillus sp. FSL H8-0048]|uniref:hypothetical protein n=1 Tax=Paenibacillus sp. FSL H8-0048 TaxID=2954508 RepID=UPI0030F9BCBA
MDLPARHRNVCCFSHKLGGTRVARLIVIGKPITFGSAWASAPIVIGKPITFGSARASGLIVIGKPITFGP